MYANRPNQTTTALTQLATRRLEQAFQACLHDAIENVLVSTFGDPSERKIALADLASMELSYSELRTQGRLTRLPFTFAPTSPARRTQIRTIFPADYAKENANYIDAFADLHDALTSSFYYIVVQRKSALWATFVDYLDAFQATQIFNMVTRTSFSEKGSMPFLWLCTGAAREPLDDLLILGALRRRVTGPATHWLHRMLDRKPYLKFVVGEAVDLGVQAVRSGNGAAEAIEAIKYAFREVSRVIRRIFRFPSDAAFDELQWKEQCGTVVRAAGLTDKHGNILAGALENGLYLERKNLVLEFPTGSAIPALATLIVRAIRAEDARMFLDRTILGRVIEATPRILEKTIKRNPAKDWPAELQFGLLMRLLMPPKITPPARRGGLLGSPEHALLRQWARCILSPPPRFKPRARAPAVLPPIPATAGAGTETSAVLFDAPVAVANAPAILLEVPVAIPVDPPATGLLKGQEIEAAADGRPTRRGPRLTKGKRGCELCLVM